MIVQLSESTKNKQTNKHCVFEAWECAFETSPQNDSKATEIWKLQHFICNHFIPWKFEEFKILYKLKKGKKQTTWAWKAIIQWATI